MKSILKLSLVSLCASGAVYAAHANNSQSASDRDSDKQLIVTEPAGADNTVTRGDSTTQTTTTYQSSGTSYSSGGTMQGSTIYPSSGYYQVSSSGCAPGLVTGREQDAYADCILHRYQAGKGSARATDEHYWNNVSPDRLYAQYPGAGASYQNFAYTSSPGASSSSSWQSSTSWSGQQGLWYGPDGKVYNSATSMTPIQGGSFRESAGAQQSSSAQFNASGSQPSATQYGTSGAQSSTELKGSQDQSGLNQSSQGQSDLNKSSQNQSGSAASEAAGANTSTQSDQNNPSSTPSSSSSTSDQSGTQASPQSSSSSSATPSSPDQSSTSSSSSTPDQSTQNSTSSSANQGSADKVRSTLQSDSTLSPISSNVTVQDQNGKVALNGTVKSEAEKQQIVSKAEETAGSGNVIDNLQVKSDNSNP